MKGSRIDMHLPLGNQGFFVLIDVFDGVFNSNDMLIVGFD